MDRLLGFANTPGLHERTLEMHQIPTTLLMVGATLTIALNNRS